MEQVNKMINKKKAIQRKNKKDKKENENDVSTIVQVQHVPVVQQPTTKIDNLQLKIDIAVQYQKPNQQLLATTYFLNYEMNKYVAIGYDIYTFEPTVIIHKLEENCLTLTSLEWMFMFFYYEQIKSYMDHTFLGNSSQLLQVTNEFTIQHDNANNYLWLQKNNQRVFISEPEWNILVHVIDFFNTIIYRYKLSTEAVKNYYQEYLSKCYASGVNHLLPTQYFAPANERSLNFNFHKLFIEIGIICRDKLWSDTTVLLLKNM